MSFCILSPCFFCVLLNLYFGAFAKKLSFCILLHFFGTFVFCCICILLHLCFGNLYFVPLYFIVFVFMYFVTFVFCFVCILVLYLVLFALWNICILSRIPAKDSFWSPIEKNKSQTDYRSELGKTSSNYLII